MIAPGLAGETRMDVVEKFGFGQPVKRTEDPRLLTGRGTYVEDIDLVGQSYAVFVRSPHAHARIKSIDTAEAAAMPGVCAIYTAAEVDADGLGEIPVMFSPKPKSGTKVFLPTRPLLCRDRVRMVGDPVSMVVAETVAAAKDAAERVVVTYEPLPAVTATGEAAKPGAFAIWDEAPRNIAFEFEQGDRAKVDAAFARAAHVTRLALVNNRVTANSMEMRGALGAYDAGARRYTLYAPVQGPHRTRSQIASAILKLDEWDVRVISNDIGGSFGMKGGNMYNEYPLVLWAARKLDRPVKWICERSEALATDAHARDHVTEAELALDDKGEFLAVRVSTLASLGAYCANQGAFVPITGLGMLACVYRTPAIFAEVTGVLTNTSPTCPYRGAGRPEAIYVIERLVDKAARELRIDPADLRRRNCIAPDSMPFKTGLVFTYDSGEFAKNMDRALELADRKGFARRRAAAQARGRLRGFGIANYIERCAGTGDERAEIRIGATGAVTLIAGTMSNGQGHETVFPHMVSRALGVPVAKIRFLQGDTDVVSFGFGTGGSRSMTLGGNALALAVEKIVEKGKKIAAHLLEAADSDIEFTPGRFTVTGTDRVVTLTEVARAAYAPERLPKGLDPGLAEAGVFVPSSQTFPNGCHVAEIEIDPETGAIEISNYAAVDDVGYVVNPLLMEGQVHGGIVQGVGQALMETVTYDPDSGQLLSGSFMDYAMPRADTVCSFAVDYNEVPCRTNPLGLKGAGEAGTVGALPAIVHAILDALAPLGVTTIDMPVTPERLFRAIAAARR